MSSPESWTSCCDQVTTEQGPSSLLQEMPAHEAILLLATTFILCPAAQTFSLHLILWGPDLLQGLRRQGKDLGRTWH